MKFNLVSSLHESKANTVPLHGLLFFFFFTLCFMRMHPNSPIIYVQTPLKKVKKKTYLCYTIRTTNPRKKEYNFNKSKRYLAWLLGCFLLFLLRLVSLFFYSLSILHKSCPSLSWNFWVFLVVGTSLRLFKTMDSQYVAPTFSQFHLLQKKEPSINIYSGLPHLRDEKIKKNKKNTHFIL